MTADGTYPSPRAGVTVSTAAELDALPVGSVVRDGRSVVYASADEGLGEPVWMEAGSVNWHAALVLAIRGPLTVLFRPDDPQPVTGDDGIDRAALAELILAFRERMDAAGAGDEWVSADLADVLAEAIDNALDDARHDGYADARAALAAARAGEADGPDWSDWHSQGYADGYLAAQRGGEAVNREALVGRGGLTGAEFVITAWHIEDGRLVADEKVAAEEYRTTGATVQAVFDLMYRRDPFAPEGCVTKAAVIAALNTPAADLAAAPVQRTVSAWRGVQP